MTPLSDADQLAKPGQWMVYAQAVLGQPRVLPLFDDRDVSAIDISRTRVTVSAEASARIVASFGLRLDSGRVDGLANRTFRVTLQSKTLFEGKFFQASVPPDFTGVIAFVAGDEAQLVFDFLYPARSRADKSVLAHEELAAYLRARGFKL